MKTFLLIVSFSISFQTHGTPKSVAPEYTVHLISDSNHTSAEHHQLTALLVEQCSTKSMVVGLESLDRNKNSEYLRLKNSFGVKDQGYCFGIESFWPKLLVYHLGTLPYLFPVLTHNKKISSNDEAKKQSLERYKQLVIRHNNSFLDNILVEPELWAKLKEFKTSKKISKITKDFTAKLIAFQGSPGKDFENWFLFYTEFLQFILLHGDIFKSGSKIPTEEILQFLEYPVIKNFKIFQDKIEVVWRDKIMSKNIIEILDITKPVNTLFYVFVGADHIPGISKNLRKLNLKVEVIKLEDALKNMLLTKDEPNESL